MAASGLATKLSGFEELWHWSKGCHNIPTSAQKGLINIAGWLSGNTTHDTRINLLLKLCTTCFVASDEVCVCLMVISSESGRMKPFIFLATPLTVKVSGDSYLMWNGLFQLNGVILVQLFSLTHGKDELISWWYFIIFHSRWVDKKRKEMRYRVHLLRGRQVHSHIYQNTYFTILIFFNWYYLSLFIPSQLINMEWIHRGVQFSLRLPSA